MQKFWVYRSSFLIKHEFHVTNVHELSLHQRLQAHILPCKEQPIMMLSDIMTFTVSSVRDKLM